MRDVPVQIIKTIEKDINSLSDADKEEILNYLEEVITFGAAFGAFFNSVAIGAGLGMLLGIVIGAIVDENNK